MATQTSAKTYQNEKRKVMIMAVVQSNNGGGVNVRSSKSVSSSRLGTIPEGRQINVVTCDATWATLVYNGIPAFVQRQFIVWESTNYGAGLGENGRALCNANSVNVRSQPNTNSTTNGSQLNKGDSVTAYEYSFDGTYVWYRIGSNRWVRGDFLAPANGYSGEGDGSVGGTPNNMYEMYGPSTQTLRSGSRGQAVTNLQYSLVVTEHLARAGVDDYGNCEGIFGTKTELAVISFQIENGLNADGIVGKQTKAALWREVTTEEHDYILSMCSAVI